MSITASSCVIIRPVVQPVVDERKNMVHSSIMGHACRWNTSASISRDPAVVCKFEKFESETCESNAQSQAIGLQAAC